MVQPVKLADLGKRKGTGFHSVDTSGQTVPPPFNAQSGTGGHENLDPDGVHQELELCAPVVQVLDFAQKQVGLAPLPVQRVETVGGNVFFKPVGDAKDGIDQLVGDKLQLDGGFTHLARSTHRHNGRFVGIETPSYAGRQVAAGGGNPCNGLARPPRVESVTVGNQLRWNAGWGNSGEEWDQDRICRGGSATVC